jgi:tetratricopeptide (TPR) repeat protein
VREVAISAPGANVMTTLAEGQFRLEFPKLKPGDTVHVSAAKLGYVVVNYFELDPTLPAKPDAKQLLILICQSARREEMARRFMGLKSLEAIERSYQKRLKDIQSLSAAEIARLREERDQVKRAAEKMAKDLAQKQPGESSQLYQVAMHHLVDGEIDRALEVLREEELIRNMEEAKKRREEADRAYAQAALTWRLRAQLLSSPNGYDVNLALASFSQILDHYAAAITAFERCLDIARRNGDKVRVLEIQSNLAKLHHDQSQIEDARKACEEALQILQDLARNNPDTYPTHVATTPNNLGIVDRDRRMEGVLEAYHRELPGKEALKAAHDVAGNKPDCYLAAAPTTLNNLEYLGNLHTIQNRMEDARKANEKALKIFRDLAGERPETYLLYVAGTQNDLGILYRAQNRIYREVLAIYLRWLTFSLHGW